MSFLTYHQLGVKGIEAIQNINQLELDVEPNKHARLKVKGLLQEQVGSAYIEEVLENKLIQLVTNEGTTKTIFAGPIVKADVTENKGVFYLELEGISATINLDLEKHSRSFQDINLTYPQVIDAVIEDVPHCVANYQVGQNEQIKVPLIQYLEKNWDFIKRLASHFGTVVVPEVSSGQPHFWFGMPQGANHNLNQTVDYKLWKDLGRFHELGGAAAGYQADDFLACEVRTWYDFEIGDRVCFRERIWTVGAKRGRMEKGLWVYVYTLGFAPAMGLKKRYNKLISGMSIQGKVLETKGERLKVHLHIDKNQDQNTAYWYPWVPASGNMMYCMPQVGTQVALYYPNEHEATAQVTSCVRTNGAECHDMGDPNSRYFTTEHNKQLALLPAMVTLAGVGDELCPLKISLIEESDYGFAGISLESHKTLKIHAKGNIKLSADKWIKCDADYIFTACNPKCEISSKYEFQIFAENVKIDASTIEKFAQIEEYNRGKFWFNLAITVVAVAALAVLAVATFGTGPLVVGAIAGGAFAAGAMAIDNWNKGESGSLKDYAITITSGAVAGAIGNMGGGVISSLFFNTVGNVVGTGVEDVLDGGGMKSGLEYGISAAAGFVGGGFDVGTGCVAKKIVTKNFAKQGAEQTVNNLCKNFGKKYAQRYTGESVATGSQKYMYTLAKACQLGKKGGDDLVSGMTHMSKVNNVAKNTKIKTLKREINYYPGKNKGAKERLIKLFADNPDVLKNAMYEQSSPFGRAVPSLAGNAAGQTTSDYLGKKYNPPDCSAYLVRGARVECSCGSHPQKVNLPEGNGVYVDGKPLLTEKDAISMVNIMDFGQCKGKNQKCIPAASHWKNSKNDFIINGENAVTMISQITCKKGGTIVVKESGQGE